MAEAANQTNDRLYKDVARRLVTEIVSGKYAVGSRLPAERELAASYDVSRPTVREAVIALEVQGIVEVRVGSGAYVMRMPGDEDIPGYGMSAFEITEARLLIEGEAAALAATQVTDKEIGEIAGLIDELTGEKLDPKAFERTDRQFHLAVAKATRNGGLLGSVTTLWNLRENSSEAGLLHEMARTAIAQPVVEEHTAILEALRARDPVAARAAMRAHLAAVLDSLLLVTEENAVEEARGATQTKRERYAKTAS